GVKVGLDFTQAQYRVEAPVHIAELLEALLQERSIAVAEEDPQAASG
ncbi:MAG: trehalose-phosphatase, partial [Arthrobacter sp.]